jgi:hypothetical protein
MRRGSAGLEHPVRHSDRVLSRHAHDGDAAGLRHHRGDDGRNRVSICVRRDLLRPARCHVRAAPLLDGTTGNRAPARLLLLRNVWLQQRLCAAAVRGCTLPLVLPHSSRQLRQPRLAAARCRALCLPHRSAIEPRPQRASALRSWRAWRRSAAAPNRLQLTGGLLHHARRPRECVRLRRLRAQGAAHALARAGIASGPPAGAAQGGTAGGPALALPLRRPRAARRAAFPRRCRAWRVRHAAAMGDAEPGAAEKSIEMWKIKKARSHTHAALPAAAGAGAARTVRPPLGAARTGVADARAPGEAPRRRAAAPASRAGGGQLTRFGGGAHARLRAAGRAARTHRAPRSSADARHSRTFPQLIRGLEAARGNGTSMISLIMHPRDQVRAHALRAAWPCGCGVWARGCESAC